MTFKNRQGESSSQIYFKSENEKGNNNQDKNKMDTEEANRLLLEEFFLGSNHDEEYMGFHKYSTY